MNIIEKNITYSTDGKQVKQYTVGAVYPAGCLVSTLGVCNYKWFAQNDYLKEIESTDTEMQPNNEVEMPIVTLDDITEHANDDVQEVNNEVEKQYKARVKLEDKEGNNIRKGSILTLQDLQEKELNVEELLNEEKLMEVKIVK